MPDPLAQKVNAAIPGEPRPRQTFADDVDRARLTPAALEAMRSLPAHWKVTGDQMAALLGVSSTTWDRIKGQAWTQSLTQDQLTRASALIGVFKGLHLLFADDMADRWVTLRNSGPLFENCTPIETMIRGGIPTMIEVRRYVDALRGGL